MSNTEGFLAGMLSGQPLDGELERIHARYIGSLRDRQAALQGLCGEAKNLKDQLGTTPPASIDVCTEADTITAAAALILSERGKAVRRFGRVLRAYCLRHGHIPGAVKRSTAIAVMVLLLAVFGEALVNVSFFLNAHMVAGPLAALLVSFLISLTNVTACTCAGYFIGRYRDYGIPAQDADNPVFRAVRAKANWLFRGFIGVMAGFHLTIGLIRSQATLEDIEHSLSRYGELLTTPEAIFLIMVGVCMSVFAYHKGKTALGGYPGVDEREQDVHTARNELQESYADSCDAIEDIFDRAESASDKLFKEQAKAVDTYNDKVKECHKESRALEQAAGQAESDCRAEIAQAVTFAMTLNGKDQQPPADLLAQYASFEAVLTAIELPAFHHPPDHSAYKADLAKAKAAALKTLSAFYQEALNPRGTDQ